MVAAGAVRQRLARVLNAAYGDGLLSEATFAHRLDLLFDRAVVDPASLVGDLTFRSPRRALSHKLAALVGAVRAAHPPSAPPPPLLGLDWSGAETQLLLGRHLDCDVVVDNLTVSRRHAQLRFRDGSWVLCDLDSTNGTMVNGRPVVRCRLAPGDHLRLGDAVFVVD